MIDRITELLKNNILRGKKELLPVTTGAGGAYVFSVDDKYIIKYAYLPELDFNIFKQYKQEYNFYKFCAGKDIDFIPEVVFQTANDKEILFVMKKYIPIKPEEWTESLQKGAMQVCARINAVNTNNFQEAIFQDEEETERNDEPQDDPYPLSLSYENWERLHNKFPEHINGSLLKEMYRNFDEMALFEEKICIPETLHHGDCHPENFLKDGGKLIVCDWQGVGIGKGIGDVAFFISRGADMGLNIDRNRLVEWYSEAFFKYTKIKVDINDFYKSIAASGFLVSFSFWAGYLQDSDIDRILNIYNAMVNNYNFLLAN